ncbi:MAG: hypothetical protein HC828_07280 [Blastochloris sp.]|nr:hypothetical protein [Blastochloris sp.]
MVHAPLRDHRVWWMSGLMLVVVSAGLWTNIQLWPITNLGYTLAAGTYAVRAIAPQSPADLGGMQVGDRVLTVYDQPIAEVLTHWNVLTLRDSTLPFVPVVVARAGVLHTLELPRTAPPLAFQLHKLVFSILALICGLTGWLLGIVRQHEAGATTRVALFWLALGGILGVYIFARSASVPLLVLVRWLLLTWLLPFGVYVHCWFPPRPISSHTARRALRTLLITILSLNLLLLIVISSTRPTIPTLAAWLARPVPLAFCLAFLSISALFVYAYQRTTVSRVRRTMRVIGLACLSVALLWVGGFVLPALHDRVPGRYAVWFDLAAGLVPLAYLASGVLPTMRALEHLLRRFSIGLAALLSLLALSRVAARWVSSSVDPLFLATLVAVVLYRPLTTWFSRMLKDHERDHAPLRQVHHALTTSLDTTTLAHMLCQSLAQTFHAPPIALYLVHPDRAEPICGASPRADWSLSHHLSR